MRRPYPPFCKHVVRAHTGRRKWLFANLRTCISESDTIKEAEMSQTDHSALFSHCYRRYPVLSNASQHDPDAPLSSSKPARVLTNPELPASQSSAPCTAF